MRHRIASSVAGVGLALLLTLPAAAGDTSLHVDESPHPYLGVVLDEAVDRPEGGVRVVRVFPDTPAERAGLEDGDVVVAADGRTVHGPRALTRVIHDHEPGSTIELTVIRDGAEQRLTPELGERRSNVVWRFEGDNMPFGLDVDPDVDFEFDFAGLHDNVDELRRHALELREHVGDMTGPLHELRLYSMRPRLGVQLTEASPELREHLGGHADAGVLVSRVIEDSAALDAGVEVGDLIEAVDGEPIRDAGDLIRALRDAEGRRITLDVIRDGRPLSLDADIPLPDDSGRGRGPRA